jgi:hypothetical protein
MKLIAISLLSITLSACTWVELNSKGRGVVIRQQTDSIDGCQRIGTVTAKTRASIVAGTSRGDKKIAEELSILARNEAATLNANTIVANNNISDGQQSFIAYSCP